ncbi:MAG: hypothetical protein RLZZ360_688 [Candidatus Parcubacteria bacterium]|jgi:hypothetical protein
MFGVELAIYVLSIFRMSSFIILPIISLGNLGCLILTIVGIVRVVQHEEKPFPHIRSLATHAPF